MNADDARREFKRMITERIKTLKARRIEELAREDIGAGYTQSVGTSEIITELMSLRREVDERLRS